MLIADIKRQDAKVNAWGVGTKLMTGGTEPALGGVYKLAAIMEDGRWAPKLKISDNPEKTTDPGIKMPIRFYDKNGFIVGDVLFTEDDHSWKTGDVISHDRMVFGQTRVFGKDLERRPLLEFVVQGGKRLAPSPKLADIRKFAQEQIARIPGETRRLVNPQIYWVGLSDRLAREKHAAIEAFWREHPAPSGSK